MISPRSYPDLTKVFNLGHEQGPVKRILYIAIQTQSQNNNGITTPSLLEFHGAQRE